MLKSILSRITPVRPSRSFQTTAKFHAIKAALVDLSGTLHVDNNPINNAPEALERLRTLVDHVKFVTNTTTASVHTTYEQLKAMGYQLDKKEIYSAISSTRQYILKHNLNPYYIVAPDARRDFPPTISKQYNSVVIGLAPTEMNYDSLNEAFRILFENPHAKFIAVHDSKYYKQADGFVLGPGAFIKGLEYATSREAIIIGKPSKYFFENAIPEGVAPEECVMIGDDIREDSDTAVSVGMKSILLKTGVIIPDQPLDPSPTVVVEDFAEAVDWLAEYTEKKDVQKADN